MFCPICQTDNSVSFHKPLVTEYELSYVTNVISSIAYSTCSNCGCCYTLDEFSPETHNQGSEDRNEDPVNQVRLNRILEHTKLWPDLS